VARNDDGDPPELFTGFDYELEERRGVAIVVGEEDLQRASGWKLHFER
jgi:hypothetical protein